MAVKHGVIDTDKHFVIDPATRSIKNESGKLTLIRYDHNSERFTFEIPRYVDKHDMSLCNKVEIHYINVGSGSSKNNGVYEVDDLQLTGDDESIVTCSWLISQNATQLVGSLNFVIRFACVNDEGIIEYAWNTGIYQGIAIANSIYNGKVIIEEYADILEQWKQDLYAEGVKIHSVEQTTTSTEDSGTNIITMTLTDGSVSKFKIQNGSKGAKGDNGSSISSIERTSGTGAAGSVDTYTITMTDGSTSTFQVRNGTNGASGDGSGDMSSTIYDPQEKKTDIYAYVDGAIKEHATDTKTNLPFTEDQITGLISGAGFVVNPTNFTDGKTYFRYHAGSSNGFTWTNPNPQKGSLTITARGYSQYSSSLNTKLVTEYSDGTNNSLIDMMYLGHGKLVTYVTDPDKTVVSIRGNYDFENWVLLDMESLSIVADYPPPSGTVKSVNGVMPDENGNVEIETGGSSGGTTITIDDALSTTSENPIQNKVVTAELANKQANTVNVEILATICKDITFDNSHPSYTLPSSITLDEYALYYMDCYYYEGGIANGVNEGYSIHAFSVPSSNNTVRWASSNDSAAIIFDGSTIVNSWRSPGDVAIISIYKVKINHHDRMLASAIRSNGYMAIASGGYHANAEGYETVASGYAAHAQGGHTVASGDYSTASGHYSKAEGKGSNAEGIDTLARGYAQHVEGAYNIVDSEGTYIHIVGNGTGNSKRSNAHTLDWDGNAWFAGNMEGKQANVTEQVKVDNGTNKIVVWPNGIAGDAIEGSDESKLWIDSNGEGYFMKLCIIDGGSEKEVATKDDIAAAITGAIEGSY